MTMQSRGEFLRGMAGAGLLAGLGGFKAAFAAEEAGALLKMGVISDVHLNSNPGSEATLRTALEYFRDRGVEAVLVAGDIADAGRRQELQLFADTWFRVFPDDKAPDGHHVERLIVYGNHCMDGWRWNKYMRESAEAAARDGLGYAPSRARIWEEVFHEEFKPIWMKTVKGIPVIGAHWETRETNPNGIAIESFMAAHGREIDPRMPFIYVQHAHPKDTCMGAWAWGHDDGRATRALSPFPNAIAFSGHSHYSLTDERSVWQGAFTSINAASLSYASFDYSLRENTSGNSFGYRGESRPHRMSNIGRCRSGHGMLVSVFADHLAIERRSFIYDDLLGDDWIVPLPAANGTYSYAKRAAKRLAPEFAAGAKVTVAVTPKKDEKDEKDFTHVTLTFPAAQPRGGCRVNEYEVTAVLCEDDVELVQAQRRMMSPDHHRPLSSLVKDVSFVFAAEDLPLKGSYRFEVRPVECFGKKGAPLASEQVKIV